MLCVGKTNHVFRIKKKKTPKCISFHSRCHSSPRSEEVAARQRGRTARWARGVRRPREWAGRPGPGCRVLQLLQLRLVTGPPPPPPHRQQLRHPLPGPFTSCCQECSTFGLTSTPFFHVLCFFPSVRVITQLQKMVTNQTSDSQPGGVRGGGGARPCRGALSERDVCLLQPE